MEQMPATHQSSRNVSRIVAQSLVGSVVLALLTWIGYRLHAGVATAALLYLSLVVVVSLRGGLGPALLLPAGGIGCLAYFFAPPRFSFAVGGTLDIVTILAFSVAA